MLKRSPISANVVCLYINSAKIQVIGFCNIEANAYVSAHSTKLGF